MDYLNDDGIKIQGKQLQIFGDSSFNKLAGDNNSKLDSSFIKTELPPIMKGIETEAKLMKDYKDKSKETKGSNQSYLNFLTNHATLYQDTKGSGYQGDSGLNSSIDQGYRSSNYFKPNTQMQPRRFHNHSNINSNLNNNIPTTSNDGDNEDSLYGNFGKDQPRFVRKVIPKKSTAGAANN